VGGISLIPEMTSSHFPIVLVQGTWLLLNGPNTVSSYTFLCLTLHTFFSEQTIIFFLNLSSMLFAPISHCEFD
jgi:hypothetical protein